MRVGTVASRYAKALFGLAEENKAAPQIFEEIRALNEALFADETLKEVLSSRTISGPERVQMLTKALASQKISEPVRNLLLLMAEKGRLGLFPEVVLGFQAQLDNSMGVARGEVRAATPLSMDDRARLEKMIHQALGKKVILTYRQDPSVIGGLVASVGSYTFDDSVESHLRRLNEELKRRVH
jgi:F-type H+-transporting ATPase subunit delta